MVKAVSLLKECVVGPTVQTVRLWEVARLDSSTTPAALYKAAQSETLVSAERPGIQ